MRAALVFACLSLGASGAYAASIDWRSPALGDISGTPALVGDSVIVVDGALSALALDGGARRWRQPLGELAPRCLTSAGELVISAADTIVAFEARSGAERWRHRPAAHAALACGACDGERFVTGTAAGEVLALDAAGAPSWSTPIGTTEAPQKALVRGVTIADGIAYVAAEQWRSANGSETNGWLAALDAATGRLLWQTRFGAEGERRAASAAPRVLGELVIVPDALGNSLLAIARSDGALRWEFRGERGALGFTETPLAEADRVFAASGDGGVYMIDARNGTRLRRTALPASAGALARCGATLVAIYQGVAFIDVASGRLLERALEGEGDFVSSGIAVVGSTFVAGGPRAVYRLRCGPRAA